MVLLEVRVKIGGAGRSRLSAFYFEHFLFWCGCTVGSSLQSPNISRLNQPWDRLSSGSSQKGFHAEQHHHYSGSSIEELLVYTHKKGNVELEARNEEHGITGLGSAGAPPWEQTPTHPLVSPAAPGWTHQASICSKERSCLGESQGLPAPAELSMQRKAWAWKHCLPQSQQLWQPTCFGSQACRDSPGSVNPRLPPAFPVQALPTLKWQCGTLLHNCPTSPFTAASWHPCGYTERGLSPLMSPEPSHITAQNPQDPLQEPCGHHPL